MPRLPNNDIENYSKLKINKITKKNKSSTVFPQVLPYHSINVFVFIKGIVFLNLSALNKKNKYIYIYIQSLRVFNSFDKNISWFYRK